MSRRELWAPRVSQMMGTRHDAAGAVAVLPDGERLAVGFADGSVRCVALATGDTLWEARDRHEPVLQALACSPDGRLLATAADDRVVRIWDASTGAVLGAHEQPESSLEVRFAPGGARLAVAGADNTVGVLNVITGERELVCEGHEAWVMSVDWSLDGGRLVSVGNDATLRVWDAATGAELERYETGERALAVAWCPAEDAVAAGLDDGHVVLLDVVAGLKERLRFRGDESAVNCLAWRRDGQRLATAGIRSVGVWQPATGTASEVFALGAPYAWRLSWAPAGDFIVATVGGDALRLWDLQPVDRTR